MKLPILCSKYDSMKKLFILLAMALSLHGLHAQKAFSDISLALGFPVGEFGDKTDAVGVGISGNLLFAIPNLNDAVQVGFGAGFMEYGNTRTDEIINLDITQGNTLIDRISIPMEIRASNSILHGQAMVRFQAPTEVVKPYIEGAIGFRRLATTTRVFDRSDEGFFRDNDNDDDLIESINNLSDWVLSYGGGGGFNIIFNNGFGIHAGVTYMLGGRADFFDATDTEQWEINFSGSGTFDPDNLDGDDLSVDTSPRNAKIDLIIAEIGIQLQFGGKSTNQQPRTNNTWDGN